ncbi:MAG: metallophosphoesterase [Bradyrhizobium sp.]
MERLIMSRRRIFVTAASMLVACHVGAVRAQEIHRAPKPLGILLAAGDIALCGTEQLHQKHEATAALLARHVREADAQNIPVRVIALGDLAYENGSPNSFECFEASWWGALAKLELVNLKVEDLLLPALGNHDVGSDAGLRYYEFFAKKSNRWVFQQDPTKKKKLGYYEVGFPDPATGPWRLFGLNSELDGPLMEVQLDWLSRQLEEKKSPCVLAFWHRPLFSSGWHGHGDCDGVAGLPCKRSNAPLCRPDADANYCSSTKIMKQAYRILYDRGGSVVLTGHDHHYEQFKRLDADAKPADKGIRSFIVGTGGAPLYQIDFEHQWKDEHEFYSHHSFGVLRMDLFADRYRWRFIPIEGDPVVAPATDTDTCNTRPN